MILVELLLLVRSFGDPVAMTSSVVDSNQTTGSIESHLIRKGLFTFGKHHGTAGTIVDARDLLGEIKMTGQLREADCRLLAFFCSKWTETIALANATELKQLRKSAAADPTHKLTTPLGEVLGLLEDSTDNDERLELARRTRLILDAVVGQRAFEEETVEVRGKLDNIQAISFTTNEAITHAYGRRPTGRDVDSLQGSISRLMTTLVTFDGYDAWTGETNKQLVSSSALIVSWSRSKHSTSNQPHTIRLAPWIVRSLAAGHPTTYNLETARKLKGCAYSLWLWLEGQKALRSRATHNKMINPVLAPLWATLGITAEREVDKRKQLVKACKTILEVDGRYRQLELVSPATKRDNWHLVAVRINAQEAVSLPTRSVLEEPMLKAA